MHRKETSVVFYQDYFNDVFTTLESDEINLFYFLLEKASEEFSGTYTKEFSISINDLPSNYEKNIRRLRTMIMVVNYHHSNMVTEREDINLLRRTRFTKDKLYYSVEKEILKPFMEHRKEFDHVFVKIEWALKSKYSKFLYRLLREHIGVEYKIHYEILLMLINLSDPKYLAGRAFNVFNRDVLKKCVEELNEWSDIHVTYYPIKNKKDPKIIDKIVFESHIQEPKIHDRELSEQEEMDIAISKRIEDKANIQFNKMCSYQNINDKSAYLNSIIQKLNRDDIEAEIRIERWLQYAKQEFRPNTNQPAVLCIDPFLKKEMITITNNFGLYDILHKRNICTKPSSTLKKLNLWFKNGAEIEFKQIGMIYDDFTIAYINLIPGEFT